MKEELPEARLDGLGFVESEIGSELEGFLTPGQWNGLENEGESQDLRPTGLEKAHLIVQTQICES